MGVNNGEISEKTISLAIRAGKLTKQLVQAAMQEFIAGNVSKRGKVSINNLAKGGKIEAIEVSKDNISDFRRVASKYDVSYAITKNTDKSIYYVMFSASNTKNIERAFQEYASGKMKSADKHEFSREKQKEFTQKAAELATERKDKSISRTNEKVIER